MNLLEYMLLAADVYKPQTTNPVPGLEMRWENHGLEQTAGREMRVWEGESFYVWAFAGTNPKDFRDLKTDLKAIRRVPPDVRGLIAPKMRKAQAKAHGGAMAIWPVIAQRLIMIDRSKPIVMVGHSLGNLYAECAALAAMNAGRQIPLVVGFGPPRTGNKAFSEFIAHHTTLITVANGKDPVTHLPPAHLGYEAENHFHLKPDRVGFRDPDHFVWDAVKYALTFRWIRALVDHAMIDYIETWRRLQAQRKEETNTVLEAYIYRRWDLAKSEEPVLGRYLTL